LPEADATEDEFLEEVREGHRSRMTPSATEPERTRRRPGQAVIDLVVRAKDRTVQAVRRDDGWKPALFNRRKKKDRDAREPAHETTAVDSVPPNRIEVTDAVGIPSADVADREVVGTGIGDTP